MKKRILSVFLCMCMVLTMVPAAFAVDGESEAITQSSSGDVAKINDTGFSTLKTAIDAANSGDTVVLQQNITLTDYIVINKNITLDLNQNVITGSGQFVIASTGGTWSLKNGAVTSTYSDSSSQGIAVFVQSGVVNIDDVDITATGQSYGMMIGSGYVYDNTSKDNVYCGSVTIGGGSTIEAPTGIVLIGRQTKTGTLVINNANVEASDFAISGNGTNDNTEITINGGSITSTTGNAIYHPQVGTLTINGGMITGTSGVQFCGAGKLTISGDADITATAEYTAFPTKPADQGDGSAEDGAALSIVSRGGGYQNENQKMDVTISGGTLTSQHNAAVSVYRLAKVDGDWVTNEDTSISSYLNKLTISGGNLTGGSQKGALEIDEDAEGNVSVTDGTFSSDVSAYVATGHTCTKDGDSNTWKVEPSAGMEATTEANGETVTATVDGNYTGNEKPDSSTGGGEGTDNKGEVSTTGGIINIDVKTNDGGGGTGGGGGSTPTTANVTVGTNALTSIKGNSNVTGVDLVTDVGTLEITKAAWNTMTDNAKGSSVVLSIEKKEGDSSKNTVYTITATAGNGNKEVFSSENSGGKKIAVSVPYKKNNGNDVKVYCTDNGLEDMNATYDDSNNRLMWTTTHFSNYEVVKYNTEDAGKDVVYQAKNGQVTYGTLADALTECANGGSITLQRNIVVESNSSVAESPTTAVYTIPNGVILNGNTYSITAENATWQGSSSANYPQCNPIIGVTASNAKVTIKNLTIIGNKNTRHGINVWANSGTASGSEVTIENVTIRNCGTAALVVNNATVTATNLTTSGNAWGAVNVDNSGKLTLTGDENSMSENVQIWTEKPTGTESGATTIITEDSNFIARTVKGVGADLKGFTYYTDDVTKLGEALNETTDTVYEDLDTALSEAASGNEIHVVKDAALDSEAVDKGVTLVVDEDVTLTGDVTNNGSIENNGKIEGDVTNNGTIVNKGTIDGEVTGNSDNMTTTVIFQTTPSNAEVVVRDNSGKVVEDSSSHTYQLTAGNYTYTVSADGYYSKSGRITVENSAITETVKLSRRSSSSGGSSSGGGSTSSNRYTVSVPSDIDNGSISVSPSRAERGDTVTITVKPDAGYELHSLIALDSDGDRITIEKERENIYTFEMPSDRVTIEATFAEIEEQPVDLPFNDVSTSDWFYDEVAYAYENDIMNGMGNGQFQPNATTNRAMVVTILYRLAGSPDLSDENLGYPFADVDASSWYGDAVYWARLNNITNGISNTNFGPDGSIIREQMAAMLYRYADFAGYDVSTGDASLSEYADASEISSYAVTAMQWANENGLITGRTVTTLEPKATATRAEVATILMRFCEDVVS